MTAKAIVKETDKNLTRIDGEFSSSIRTATKGVFEDEVAMAEPAGEMPLVFWP